MRMTVAKTLCAALSLTGLMGSLASAAPPNGLQNSHLMPLSADKQRDSSGKWSDWQPLLEKGDTHQVDYSVKETSVAPNGHETWSGKFRNREAKNVKLKVRCFFMDHRGDEQEITFTLYVGGQSTSDPISDIVPLSYAPIKLELADFHYAD